MSSPLSRFLESYDGEPFLILDDFDEAFIGLANSQWDAPRAVYSFTKIMSKLEERMTREQAVDYYYYNIEGSLGSDEYPIVVDDCY